MQVVVANGLATLTTLGSAMAHERKAIIAARAAEPDAADGSVMPGAAERAHLATYDALSMAVTVQDRMFTSLLRAVDHPFLDTRDERRQRDRREADHAANVGGMLAAARP